MKLETIRTTLQPAVDMIFPAVLRWKKIPILTRKDTDTVIVCLREYLTARLPDYKPSRPALLFVRDFLAKHSDPMPDDFTECLARYILSGEECVERI